MGEPGKVEAIVAADGKPSPEPTHPAREKMGAPPGASTARAVYLESAYDLIRASLMLEAPPRREVALAYSFPSRGARASTRRGRLGECHYGKLEGSEAGERMLIVIHPSEWATDVRVLAVLAHEMAHAALGAAAGHHARFAALVKRVGLGGRPAATVPSPAFTRWVAASRTELPPFPAGALALRGRRVQGTRLRLYECRCTPAVKVRCARDDLAATCRACGEPFVLVSAARPSRLEGTEVAA